MSSYPHAPHQGGSATRVQGAAPNAALLIDFDNVTMGMRSDLSKDLKKLLQSDVIRGKVTVQRAYADWRRYPQYIVPLSENSIDLIFAPAYGSSKKNATDIRMAIDGMELVFTRPEIGTYILLTGDSDFSSLVLKLKEYGKYVIGVGIQESSSDILVQNCDEYYSYNNLAGLTKTDETGQKPSDPWVLAEKALDKMESRDDVMRSDRMKQVMMEIDPGFDEGNFGFSKFSKFLTEAASKGIVHLKKMENGQYEISSKGGSRGGGSSRSDDRRGKGGRSRGRDESRRSGRSRSRSGDDGASGDPLQTAYDLLVSAVGELVGRDGEAIRDSDVKRKMLEKDRTFDESELGYSKFSRFLQQADEDGKIALQRRDTGNYEVALPGEDDPASAEPTTSDASGRGASRSDRDTRRSGRTEAPDDESSDDEAGRGEAAPTDREAAAAGSGDRSGSGGATGATGGTSRRLGPRRGSTRRRSGDDEPPIFEGQVVQTGAVGENGDSSDEGDDAPGAGRDREAHAPGRGESDESASPIGAVRATSRGRSGRTIDPETLGLPTDAESVKRYLANRYKGVGVKTAEAVVDELGEETFQTLHDEPERVYDLIPDGRAETLLEAWRDDYRRRREIGETEGDVEGMERSRLGRRTRRGGRRGS